jgi:predicted permease
MVIGRTLLILLVVKSIYLCKRVVWNQGSCVCFFFTKSLFPSITDSPTFHVYWNSVFKFLGAELSSSLQVVLESSNQRPCRWDWGKVQ